MICNESVNCFAVVNIKILMQASMLTPGLSNQVLEQRWRMGSFVAAFSEYLWEGGHF
jgi:hypothetical protein